MPIASQNQLIMDMPQYVTLQNNFMPSSPAHSVQPNPYLIMGANFQSSPVQSNLTNGLIFPASNVTQGLDIAPAYKVTDAETHEIESPSIISEEEPTNENAIEQPEKDTESLREDNILGDFQTYL
jgi:hypothetical protein